MTHPNAALTPHHSPNKTSAKTSRSGYACVHTLIDDHSRVAYAEIHDDETAQTATAVLVRAVVWFNQRGIAVERVLSDNGGAYRSHLWRTPASNLKSRTSAPARIAHRRTARSSASTARTYAAAIPPRLSVVGGYMAGCTTTTITDPTLHAAASRPSHD